MIRSKINKELQQEVYDFVEKNETRDGQRVRLSIILANFPKENREEVLLAIGDLFDHYKITINLDGVGLYHDEISDT